MKIIVQTFAFVVAFVCVHVSADTSQRSLRLEETRLYDNIYRGVSQVLASFDAKTDLALKNNLNLVLLGTVSPLVMYADTAVASIARQVAEGIRNKLPYAGGIYLVHIGKKSFQYYDGQCVTGLSASFVFKNTGELKGVEVYVQNFNMGDSVRTEYSSGPVMCKSGSGQWAYNPSVSASLQQVEPLGAKRGFALSPAPGTLWNDSF